MGNRGVLDQSLKILRKITWVFLRQLDETRVITCYLDLIGPLTDDKAETVLEKIGSRVPGPSLGDLNFRVLTAGNKCEMTRFCKS